MSDKKIDVIATTISGSISDWGKVKKIVPLFKEHGYNNVALFEADSHKQAREIAAKCVKSGTRIVISAGGSGTFNAVLEGICDSGISLGEVSLGFLRKGSADLIGKTLGMPDDLDEAIGVFADSISKNKTIGCDVILAESPDSDEIPRHFVGYAGAEIFGLIPRITENKYTKYYKGLLSQFFGDLGPFFIGASLSLMRKLIRRLYSRRIKWKVIIDGKERSGGFYQAFIIVNGDLGKDMPLAKDVPLGSGDFYLFGLKDIGALKLIKQFKLTWDASIMNDPDKWGMERFCVKNELELKTESAKLFDANIDGSTMVCRDSVRFKIVDRINLISR